MGCYDRRDRQATFSPALTEHFEKDIKKLVDYKYNEDGKHIKVTNIYQLETHKVSKSIAKRSHGKNLVSLRKITLPVLIPLPHMFVMKSCFHNKLRRLRRGEGRSIKEIERRQHCKMSSV